MAEEFVGEEHGGEEMGYRVPLALREEEKAPAAGEPGTPAEGAPAAKPGDEVPPGEGEFEVNEETILELGEEDLDNLITQEELGVDPKLPLEEKRLKVAEALGYEVVEEPEGVPEATPEGGEDLKQQVLDLNRKLAMLTPAADLMENLENDPEATLRDLAQYYGVSLGTPAAAPAPSDLKFEIPKLEPGQNEDMPTYLTRLVQAGLQSLVPQLRAAQPQPAARPGPRKGATDPRVVNAIKYLTEFHPDWPNYQGKMTALLRVDPDLIKDPTKLYERASGRKTGPAARSKAVAKKLNVKKPGATGERGGRSPLKLAKRKLLNPSKGRDFAEAWDRAKREAMKGG